MGAVYAERVLGRTQPTVGLLSNGEEDGKGDERVRETASRLRRSSAWISIMPAWKSY